MTLLEAVTGVFTHTPWVGITFPRKPSQRPLTASDGVFGEG